ncbi:MAG: hypothetical protein L0Y66_18395, partial [Myxococcaceae bacterium]|nr:hypothetical protein [Myxococcaceae bacterium]MCI0671586.1 hypothetical protein [Myxococcaceae bacterium]
MRAQQWVWVIVLALTGCQDFEKAHQECLDEGRCIPEGGQLRQRGEACVALDVCEGGACVDGVCCESACEGQCEACNVAGSEGSCVAVSGEPRGAREACTGEGSMCGGACDGVQRLTCAYPTLSCRQEGCSAGVRTEPASCSAGACPALVSTQCAGGICGENDCATVKQVVAGYDFTCALLSDGTVWCWGENSSGQLGLGDEEPRFVPTRVPTLSGVKALAASQAGSSACAILSNDTLSCWGSNYYGQLGIGVSGGYRSTPQPVETLANVQSVAVGGFHACAVVRTGSDFRAWCWGENSYGQVGDGTSGANRPNPVAVCSSGSGAGCFGYTNLWELALGDSHSCARIGSSVRCWGSNGAGQLGSLPDFLAHPNPLTVSGVTTSVAPPSPVVFAGADVSCAINSDGEARCWGSNSNGQLANGDFGQGLTQHVPSQLCAGPGIPCAPLGSVAAIAIGEVSACAQPVSGPPVCWGRDTRYQLGDGAPAAQNAYASSEVAGAASIVGLTLGSYHGCTWKDAEVRCWGWSGLGQLGNDDQVT